MRHPKLAFMGFGNVGQALAELLIRKEKELREDYQLTFSVTGIATARHGSAVNPEGIDLPDAVQTLRSGGRLEKFSQHPAPLGGSDFIQICGADVLLENTPVNYDNGQPAVDHLRQALSTGMHAITANKGSIVFAYQELLHEANSNGVRFLFESTVMDGAPIFSLFREALPGAKLIAFRGILNSTSNLILNRMEQGEAFDEAVRYAQSIGIAETDPSGDIDGWDAAIKIAALTTVLMGFPLKPKEVERIGIRGITHEAIALAATEGERWKLICSARRTKDGVQARVAPEKVAANSPFYNVEGTSSTIQFETDVLGPLTIVETDPGPETTAYGLLADLLNIYQP